MMRLGQNWYKRPRLCTGPLSIMAEEILAHADSVMLMAHARLGMEDYWDAYVAAALTGTGIYRTPGLNAIQRAVVERIEASKPGDRIAILPARRYSLRVLRQMMDICDSKQILVIGPGEK